MRPLLIGRDRLVILLITFMLFAGYGLNYLDRVAFGTLAVLIRSDMALTASQMGLAFGAFSAGYMMCGLIAGWAVDKFPVQRILWMTVLAWSVFCGSIAAATGLGTLIAARFLFGAAESPWLPAMGKMAARIFPTHRFAGSFSIVQAGAAVGAAIAAPMASLLAPQIGWEGMFLIVSALGVVWAILWCGLMAFKGASEGRADKLSSTAEADPAINDRGLIVTFKDLLANRAVVAIAASLATTGYLQTFFTTWFPSFLMDEFGFSLQQLGAWASAPWIAGLVGVLSGGYLSDWVAGKSADPIAARKMLLVLALGITALAVAAVPFVTSGEAAVVLMCLAMGSCAFGGANYFVMLIPLAGLRDYGAATALAMICGQLAGTLAPVISGYIIEYGGGYAVTFLIAGCVMFAGALAPLLLLTKSAYPNAASPNAAALS